MILRTTDTVQAKHARLLGVEKDWRGSWQENAAVVAGKQTGQRFVENTINSYWKRDEDLR